MKQKIHMLLPIAIVIFLPLLGLVTRNLSTEVDFVSTPFYGVWIRSSLLFYVLWYLLEKVPNLFPTQKAGSVLLTVFLCFLLVHLAVEVFELFPNIELKGKQIMRILVVAALFLTIQYALRTQSHNTKLILEKTQIEAENYKTQLQSLRSKVDPHFLFNTLNILRTMVRNKHEDAEKFVMSLSGFYRQTLQYNENSTIELAKKIEVLEAYLFLMQSGNQTGLTIDIVIEPNLQARFIPILRCFPLNMKQFSFTPMTAKNIPYIKS